MKPGKTNMGKLSFILSALWLCHSAMADDKVWYWTGGAGDNDVMTVGNWQDGSGSSPTAGKYDWGKAGNRICIFDPGAGRTLSISNTMWQAPWYFKFKEIRVLSGTVNFCYSKGTYCFQADSGAVTSAIHVATSAVANWNSYMRGENDTAVDTIRKTGGGELIFGIRIGHSEAQGAKPIKALVVEDGTCRRNDLSATVGSFTWRNNVRYIVVRKDAVFTWNSYGLLEPNSDSYGHPILQIDKGGLARAYASSGTSIEGLSGEGDFETSGSHNITLRLRDGDYVFSGSFKGNRLYIDEGATHTFAVGAAETLANISLTNEGFRPTGDHVRFASGVGEFWINRYCGNLGGVLRTEDVSGRPIRLHINGDGDCLSGGRFVGAGTLVLSKDLTESKGLTNGQLSVSCSLSSDDGVGLYFGRDIVGTDPVLSSIRSIEHNGSLVFNGSGKIDVPCAVTSALPITVKGGGAAFASICKTAGDFELAAATDVKGGELVGPLNTWRNSYESMYTRPRRIGSSTYYSSANGYLSISNVHFIIGWGGGSSQVHTFGSFSAVDSLIEMIRPLAGSLYESEYEIALNGTTCQVAMPIDPYNFKIPNTLNIDTDPGAIDKPWTIRVGEKGARLVTDQACCFGETSCHSVRLGMAIEPAVGIPQDGGLTLGLANVLYLYRPVNLRGTVTLCNSKVCPCASAFSQTASVFGTGDLVLDNVWIASSINTRIASDTGSKLRVNASARMSFRDTAEAAAATVTAGDENAAEPSLVFGPAGALFLSEPGTATTLTSGNLVVKGGMPAYADGRVKAPVFAAAKGSQDHCLLDFVSAGAQGFTAYPGSVSDLDHGASSVVNADADDGTLEVPANATREIAALRASGWGQANWNTIRAAVKINAGARLKVGDAGGVAQVLLNCRSNYGRAEISGAGTLDFGTNAVVVGCGACANTSSGRWPSLIAAKIEGSGPVAFAGMFGERHAGVILSGMNSLSGDVYVTDAQVRLENSLAFGTADVHVLGGNAVSGQLCFDGEGLVVANRLTVSGNGIHCVGSDITATENGALWFTRDATVSGPVVIDGSARVCARKHTSVGEGSRSGVGTFTGTISGGHLQLMNNDKPIVLSGSNTYTGGTEIVSATLTLRGPCSAGTGEVVLDNGVLRFENDAPVTFANDIEGVGTIEIAGTAPVTFAGNGLEALPAALRTLAPGSLVDIPDFAACTIYAADGDLDLGGASLAVSGFGGSGRVSNGTLAVSGDINPGGAGRIGTLTFAAGVLSPSSATFVCDVAAESADKIVVEDDFDLSGLAFRTVYLGRACYTQKVFVADGLTGTFSGTQFAKRYHSVSYGETDVTLDTRPFGLVITVK